MLKPRRFSTTRLAATTLLILLGTATAVRAENPRHLRQLLETGRCRNCDLSQANLNREDLRNADLAGTNLRGANLSSTDLSDADLSNANLENANLQNAKLNRTIVTNTNFRGTILDRNSQNPTGDQRQNWGRDRQGQTGDRQSWGRRNRYQWPNSGSNNQPNYANYPNQPIYSNQPDPSNNIDQRYQTYEAEIRRIYGELTNQSISRQELRRYMWDLANGRSISDLRQDIAQSPEARAALNGLYQQLLGREIDAGGSQTWTGYMVRGRNLADVRREIVQGAEVSTALNRVYQQVLGRQIDASGLAAWTNYMRRGNSLADVQREIAVSQEAQPEINRALNRLYQQLLGREIDASGLATWTSYMRRGNSLADVEREIAASPEAQARR
jgi:Pentapeptide repeats (8 copies)/Domain of unknown function (DUF4214)